MSRTGDVDESSFTPAATDDLGPIGSLEFATSSIASDKSSDTAFWAAVIALSAFSIDE